MDAYDSGLSERLTKTERRALPLAPSGSEGAMVTRS